MRIRKEQSKNSPYYISGARQMELYWFCKQWNDWLKEYNELGLHLRSIDTTKEKVDESNEVDPTYAITARRMELWSKIQLVKSCCDSLGDIGRYIFLNVVDGMGYDEIVTNVGIEHVNCSKNEFYTERHHFFYILSNAKQ